MAGVIWLGQSLEHEIDHCELCEAFGGNSERLVMRHETAVAAQPRQGALDDPSSPYHLEAVLVGALDDLQRHWLIGEIGGKSVTGITAVGEDVSNEGEQAARSANEGGGAVAVLHTSRDYLNGEQQADGVDQQIALDALYLLASIVADRIGRAPPFSVAFTLCVSMMAALGEASRPSASRHLVSNS